MTEPGPADDPARFLAALIDSFEEAVIGKDLDGIVVSWSRGAERLYGYAADEAIGRSLKFIIPDDRVAEFDEMMARIRRGERIDRRETVRRAKSGREVEVAVTITPVVDAEGGIVGAATVARDLTAIRESERARLRLEEQLREQTALARLGEMAAVIAHEVKNPLAAVRGAIQVIGTRLPPDGREAHVVTDVIARLDGLDRLMQDLLLFARPPKPKPRPTDVAGLIAATADLLIQDPTLGGVRVNIAGTAPLLMADPDLLKIVFLNLLVNGAQAMQGRGAIDVTISAARDACDVVVTDAGPGIPADIREKIFNPFFTTKARGSGLGLPTVKRLVEAHSGRISLECPVGGGTAMSIHLPA
jgi:PAS domain S-box-containing protein